MHSGRCAQLGSGRPQIPEVEIGSCTAGWRRYFLPAHSVVMRDRQEQWCNYEEEVGAWPDTTSKLPRSNDVPERNIAKIQRFVGNLPHTRRIRFTAHA
jgi:hypothetical protein